MLADEVDAVVGGDTHRDSHALEMVGPSGATISTVTITNDDVGYADAVSWIADTAPGPRLVIGLEGTRSYGIGLCRALQVAGFVVVEVERPRRQDRRRGKSDPGDARLAALHVLRMPADRKVLPRSDGDREALRILLGARREMTSTRTRQINRLRALLLTGDDDDRALCRGPMSDTRLQSIARRPGPADQHRAADPPRRNATAGAGDPSRDLELAANKKQLAELVESFAPGLLDRLGIGPVSAAQAVVSFSHVGRCRNDAAFAALAGASPVPASSGRTVRYRLNRGGDRQLNRALHDIAKARWRDCPRTHAYIERRRAEGKSDREIRRCIKRYVARELFRALTAVST